MRILDDVPFAVDAEEVFSQLHLDTRSQYAGEVNALIDQVRELARPRALYDVAFVEERAAESVVIGEATRELERALAQGGAPASSSPPGRSSSPPGQSAAGRAGAREGRARFVSKVLRANLDEVERVFPYVATCGPELDAVSIESGDVFGQFCRDILKEMALRAAIAHLVAHLKESYSLEALVSMNPGSGDVNVWPIQQQRELFAFLGDAPASIGVVLTESCLMVPNKSVSGLLYPSEDGFQSCQLCHREGCPNRRTPFDPHLWEERFGG
jgi:hypothetical protein